MRSHGRVVRGAVVALVATSSLSACSQSDFTATDLCAQYAQASKQAQEVKALDPARTDVDQLRSDLDAFQASLDQLQAASDGRLDQVITDLRDAVNDFVEAAVDNGKKAVDAAEPLLTDSLNDVDDRWAALKQRADDECNAS
jgi:major membrane immunogen (membrane-anchored lipoprotein)